MPVALRTTKRVGDEKPYKGERLLTARLHIMRSSKMQPFKWLRTVMTTPPGGWRFTDPDTGLEIEAKSYESLVERVLDHRSYKGLCVEDIRAVTETQLAEGCEPNWWQTRPR